MRLRLHIGSTLIVFFAIFVPSTLLTTSSSPPMSPSGRHVEVYGWPASWLLMLLHDPKNGADGEIVSGEPAIESVSIWSPHNLRASLIVYFGLGLLVQVPWFISCIGREAIKNVMSKVYLGAAILAVLFATTLVSIAVVVESRDIDFAFKLLSGLIVLVLSVCMFWQRQYLTDKT